MLHHIDFRQGEALYYCTATDSFQAPNRNDWYEIAKNWPSAKLVLVPIADGGKLVLIAPDDTYYSVFLNPMPLPLIEGPPAEIREAVDAHLRMHT